MYNKFKVTIADIFFILFLILIMLLISVYFKMRGMDLYLLISLWVVWFSMRSWYDAKRIGKIEKDLKNLMDQIAMNNSRIEKRK